MKKVHFGKSLPLPSIRSEANASNVGKGWCGDGGYIGHMDSFGGYEGKTRSKLQQSAIFARPSVHRLILSGKSLERKS